MLDLIGTAAGLACDAAMGVAGALCALTDAACALLPHAPVATGVEASPAADLLEWEWTLAGEVGPELWLG